MSQQVGFSECSVGPGTSNSTHSHATQHMRTFHSGRLTCRDDDHEAENKESQVSNLSDLDFK
jgi:hypothetical protein